MTNSITDKLDPLRRKLTCPNCDVYQIPLCKTCGQEGTIPESDEQVVDRLIGWWEKKPADWFSEKMMNAEFREAYWTELVRERLAALRSALAGTSLANPRDLLDAVGRALLNLPPDAALPWEDEG